MKRKRQNNDDVVRATVILRSRTGKSLFERKKGKKGDTKDYRPHSELFTDAKNEFKALGFKVHSKGRFSIAISTTRDKFEEFFNVELTQEEHPVFAGREKPTTKYFVTKDEIIVPEELRDIVDRIVLQRPIQLFESPIAPNPEYHCLYLPEEISVFMRGAPPHAHGRTGHGINVVMVDTGFYNHKYYDDKGYSISVEKVDEDWDEGADEWGHGTGIAANLLAVAPGINFTMVKMSDGGSLDGTNGFEKAVDLKPDIITCSWGYDAAYGPDPTLETLIEDAVDDGIVVIFACGNDGPIGWPGDMPDVISVGGAYIDETFTNWEAAGFASSGNSPNYVDRNVPDVCGITGHDPLGILIVMPTEPDCIYDNFFGGGNFPNADETETDDGWLVASGTSSAAPMVAGVVALMLEKNSDLSPGVVKMILQLTARDITQGTSASGHNAAIGVDLATGYGLVDGVEALEACFIATATYGSRLAPEVQMLRSIRDSWLQFSGTGRHIVRKAEEIYYRRSPILARIMRQNPRLTSYLRWIFIAPIVKCLRFGTKYTIERGGS